MLLYRPLIIDWLPVPFLTHHSRPAASSTTLTYSVSVSLSHCPHPYLLCLAFLPIMSPSLSISFSVSLLLFSCTSSGIAGSCLAFTINLLCCLLNRLCSIVHAKSEGRSLLRTSPAPRLCPASPALGRVNRSRFWCWFFMLCLVT